MNERDKLRIHGDENKKQINLNLFGRNERRLGIMDNGCLPILENKKPISIIISAYQTQKYIEETLNSIENQTYFINNNNFEVLVGVDACQDTLNKLLEIKHKYRNLRIFMMDNNMGTYITSNTLLDIIKNENIIRFDGDDIMKPEMINEIMYFVDNYNIIRFKYLILIKNVIQKNINFIRYPHGVGLFKLSLYNKLGGYESWMCAADTELLKRGLSIIKEKLINKPLFYRRMHQDSLTQNILFGANSEIRKEYKKLIGNNQSIKINKIVNTYVEY